MKNKMLIIGLIALFPCIMATDTMATSASGAGAGQMPVAAGGDEEQADIIPKSIKKRLKKFPELYEPLNEKELKEAKEALARLIYQGRTPWVDPSPAEVANVLDAVPDNLSVYDFTGKLMPLIERLAASVASRPDILQAVRYLIQNRIYDDNLDAVEQALFSLTLPSFAYFTPRSLYLLSDYLYGKGRNLEARNTKGLTVLLRFAKQHLAENELSERKELYFQAICQLKYFGADIHAVGEGENAGFSVYDGLSEREREILDAVPVMEGRDRGGYVL